MFHSEINQPYAVPSSYSRTKGPSSSCITASRTPSRLPSSYLCTRGPAVYSCTTGRPYAVLVLVVCRPGPVVLARLHRLAGSPAPKIRPSVPHGEASCLSSLRMSATPPSSTEEHRASILQGGATRLCPPRWSDTTLSFREDRRASVLQGGESCQGAARLYPSRRSFPPPSVLHGGALQFPSTDGCRASVFQGGASPLHPPERNAPPPRPPQSSVPPPRST